MPRLRARGFISFLLSMSFLVVVATGLVLWLSHSPQTLGIGKGVWKHAHIFVSLLMLAAAIAHLWLNWSALWSCLWEQTTRRVPQKVELILALATTATVLCMASLEGHGAMRRLDSMSIREIAERTGAPVDQLVSVLRNKAIIVHDPADSVQEIARHNGATSGTVLSALHQEIPTVRGEPQH